MNFTAQLRLETPETGLPSPTRHKEAEVSIRRRRALKRVNSELSKGNFKTAFSLLKQLQGKPGGLRGFGAAKQVPKRLSAMEELEFDGIDLSRLRPVVNSVVDSIERCIQFCLLDGDQIREPESLFLDEGTESSCEEDHFLCLQHEAGHFLAGYLLGALPKGYKIPSVEDLRNGNFVGGKVEFWGFEFLREVGAAQSAKKNIRKGQACDKANRGKISSKTLNRFSCMILGGLVAEHLAFGYSEGHHSDVDKLDKVLKWLGFTEGEAKLQVRWAALNTVFVLHHHREARSRLVEAMAREQSIGFCIDVIETAIIGEAV